MTASPTTPNDQPRGPHAHDADLDACLDFINSLEFEDGAPVEHLPTVDEAVAYFALRDLAHEADLRAQAAADGPAWLDRVHGSRTAMREVWDAQVDGRAPSATAIALVNEVLGHPTRIELRPGIAGVALGHRHASEDPTGEALARVIEPLIDAIETGETGRFRVCANDGCRWVFEDTSRAGRRRWCDMASCGNRAKVRRYRTRQRETADDAAGGEPGDTTAT
jgi:predicted RNA-binding Zn ribbon-like protein